MRRHYYLYGRTHYLTQPPILDAIAEIHRATAAVQARAVGLLDHDHDPDPDPDSDSDSDPDPDPDPDGDGSRTHPSLSRSLHADGTVVTPLFKSQCGERRINALTGEVPHARRDPDASLDIEGTGEAAWGNKFVIVATRDTTPNSWTILDVSHVATSGGEAAMAVDMSIRPAQIVPGAQAVIYDIAFRGVHHKQLMRDLGLMTVNRVAAAAAGSRKGRKRVEKTTFIETKTVRTGASERNVRLFSQGGRVGLGERREDGELAFVPLDRVRTHRAESKAGTFRWYNDYRLPDTYDAGVVTVRLHGNDEDKKRRFNRTENVRPIPPGDPDFERLYRRRNDAESINWQLDDSLFLRRAHTVGQARQTLNLLIYAMGINALAVHLHRTRHAPPAAA